MAARAHATATISMRATPKSPIVPSANRAWGLRRHSGSRKPPGIRSARQDIDAMTQPNAKKIGKRVRPRGRRSNSAMPLPNGSRLSCGRYLSAPVSFKRLLGGSARLQALAAAQKRIENAERHEVDRHIANADADNRADSPQEGELASETSLKTRPARLPIQG